MKECKIQRRCLEEIDTDEIIKAADLILNGTS